jgi:glutamyl-tRNA synthetase
MSKVVTRVAPSPTGLFHIGTARTALFNFLYARSQGGSFVVRVEDTDKERSTKEYEENILEGLSWLGLEGDTVVRQSERTEHYTKALELLVHDDKAYVSQEPAKSDPSQTVAVVRLRNPGKEITFHDEVRGAITFDTTELGDFVIARSMNDPLYHLAVVVDDAAMGITHVIRGEDHISNTPRQILLQEALGYERPIYAHLPLILAPDKSKMSKRKGAVSMSEYREQGFVADAIVNYLALLGWNPGTDQEVFTRDELINAFSFDGVQKGGAVFDIEKLKWLNREHLSSVSEDDRVALLTNLVPEHALLLAVMDRSAAARADMLERFSTAAEFREAVLAGDFSFYEAAPSVTAETLAWKKDPEPHRIPEHLDRLVDILDKIDKSLFTAEAVKDAVWPYADEVGRGSVLWPLRVALSGKDRSPAPFVLAEALGKEETLERLNRARACFD